jgi:hypothetical protein
VIVYIEQFLENYPHISHIFGLQGIFNG